MKYFVAALASVAVLGLASSSVQAHCGKCESDKSHQSSSVEKKSGSCGSKASCSEKNGKSESCGDKSKKEARGGAESLGSGCGKDKNSSATVSLK